MSTYNAELFPDIPRAQILSRNYNFIPTESVKTDEWNLDSATRISSFHNGTGKIKIHFRTDPRDMPLI